MFRRVTGMCVAFCLLLICLVARMHLLLALHGSHPTLEPAVNAKCYCESDPSLTLMEGMLNVCGVDTDDWLSSSRLSSRRAVFVACKGV